MRSGEITVLAALALIVPWAAYAADTGPAPQPAGEAAQPQDPGSEMICRRMTVTGTLLPGPKICKTRREWEQQRQNARDLLNDDTTRSLQRGQPGG